MSKRSLFGMVCIVIVLELMIPLAFSQETADASKQVFGPQGIMDTSPIIEVPVVEEEPIDHETIDKISLEERLAKYDVMLGDLPRAGAFTPYYKGQLTGDLDQHSATEPKFLPFIWIEPENGKGKRVSLHDERSSNRRYDELELKGDSSGKAAWTTRTIPISPGKLYRFSLYAASSNSNCTLAAGVDYARRTWNDLSPRPKHEWLNKPGLPPRRSFLLLTPENRDEIQVQVGPGKGDATYEIVRVHVEPVFPIYRGLQSSIPLKTKVLAGTSSFIGLPGDNPKNVENRGGDFLRLGDGERIENGLYHFTGTFGDNGVFHRPIQSTTATFDTDRIRFAPGNELVYRFELQPIRVDEKPASFIPNAIALGKGKVRFNVIAAKKGSCSFDWSTDGIRWETSSLALQAADKTIESEFDAKNAKTVFVRITNAGAEEFAVKQVSLDMAIDSNEYSGDGKTVIATLRNVDSFHDKSVEGCKTVPLMFSADNALYKLFINESETDQGFGCSYMDYGGPEDRPGIHGDGSGKWTQITFGNNWGAVRPHQARINVWVYNWFDDINSFHFTYQDFSFGYEIRQSRTPLDGVKE